MRYNPRVHRLWLITLNAGVACFLALGITSAGFWVRSYSNYDQIGRRTVTLGAADLVHHTREFTSVEGRLVLKLETARLTSDHLKYLTPVGRQIATSPGRTYWRHIDGFAPFWTARTGSILNRLGFASLRMETTQPFVQNNPKLTSFQTPLFVASQSRDVRLLVFPHWFPTFVCAVAPALVARRTLRRRRAMSRAARGHCPLCDYDLRNSPHRCPECGHPRATKNC